VIALAERLARRAGEEDRKQQRAHNRRQHAERNGRGELARYWDLVASFHSGRRQAFELAARAARQRARS
jgi:hypothetical protein